VAVLSTTNVHGGTGSLLLSCTNSIQVSTNSKLRYFFTPQLKAGKIYTLSFWYLPSSSNVTLKVAMVPTLALSATLAAGVPAKATPGVTNSVTASLPDYPALWLNEVQAENLYGNMDAAGERDPWVELYNSGTNVISLTNYWLAANYTNLAQWAFPGDAVIQPGERLVVWLDGQPEQSTNREYHASFRLAPTNGAVALSRTLVSGLQLVDYLNYTGLPANYSYGDLPDGQPIERQKFSQATPGATNSEAVAAVQVYINEWMAYNTFTVTDPADGNKYKDWFELYNPGDQPADLGGYYLTDTLGTLLDKVPAGFVVPARGYLLVWADSKTDLNTNRTDLHVSFKLNQAGEAIGLYRADGSPVDAVTFGQQTNDVSQGHYPDGTGPLVFMMNTTPRGANRFGNVQPPAPPNLVAPGLSLGTGNFTFSLGTESGRTYQVEYVDHLGDTNWLKLTPTYSGTGDLLPVSLSLTNAPQRFFRITVLP
jgi:hypothetical protein